MNNLLSTLLCEVLMIRSNSCFVIDEVHLFKSLTEQGLINRKVDYLLIFDVCILNLLFIQRITCSEGFNVGSYGRIFFSLTKTYLIVAVLWILVARIVYLPTPQVRGYINPKKLTKFFKKYTPLPPCSYF